MDSKTPRPSEDPCNTETDEGTVALRKNRSRRVSFADREITSVHIFNRDDDEESPSEDSHPTEDPDNEVLGFFRDLADSDDSKDASLSVGEGEDEDEEVVSSRKSFLRPIASPSPRSRIVASPTSNDEDNFFGPVSANFIMPGRLSDSAVSDDNHDITMDSTAFSMHFRSLVRSESGGDLKTPTTATLAFEENVVTPSGSGALMELTNPVKETPRFPLPVKKLSGSRDSNVMSLVGENPPSYDYARLSPTMEVLLALGNNELPLVDMLDPTNPKSFKNGVPMFDNSCSGSIIGMDGGDKERDDVAMLEKSAEGELASCLKSQELNGVSSIIAVDHSSSELPPDLISKYVDIHIQSPQQLGRVQFPAQTSKERISNRLTQVKIDSTTTDEMMAVDVKPPAVTSDTSPNKGTQVKLDRFMHSEFQQYSTSPRGRKYIFDLFKNFDEQQRTPLGGSSLSAKQGRISLNADNSYKQLSYATPSRLQQGWLSSVETRGGTEAVFATQRNNSSLQVFEPSPLASTLKDGIERSKKRLSKLRSSATSLVTASMDKNKNDSKCVSEVVPVINLEKHLLSMDPDSMTLEIKSQRDGDGCTGGASIKGSGGSSSKSEGLTGLVNDEASLDHMSTHAISREITSQLMTDVAQLHQFNWLHKEARQQQLIPEKYADGNHVILGTDSSSAETNRDCSFSAALECVSNSVEKLGRELTPLVEHHDISLLDTKQRVQNKEHFSIGSGQRGNTSAGFRTPLREKNVNSFNVGGLDCNTLIVTCPTYSPTELARKGELRSPSMKDDNGHQAEASPRKSARRKELVKNIIQNDISHSPAVNKSCNALDNGNVRLLVGEHIIPSGSNYSGNAIDDNHLELQKADSPLPLKNLEGIPGQKRRIDELFVGNSEHANKISRICGKPNIHQSQSFEEFMSECSKGGDKGEKMVEFDPAIKHWTAIVQKFSTGSTVLLSPLVDKLDESAISLLQDNMENLQKITMCQILCTQIQSQRTYDHAVLVWQKRVVEAKLLLYKLLYEKAGQQLMSTKLEKLMKKSHKLRSATQEIQMLRINLHQSLHVHGGRKSQAVDNTESSSKVSKEDSCEKVDTLRHELELFEKKVETLTKYFQSYSKTKAELSCDEMILLLNNHLKKRTTCRLMRGCLQLWEIDNFSSWGGQHSIVLKYQGLFQHRFTTRHVPTSDMHIAIELNDVEITKKFPNMDAHVAFAFALNVESTKKNIVSRVLAQEIQIMNSCLQNLVDVVEEVQHAQLECSNLVQTSFTSSTVEQLDLQLSFYDFESGAKVIVTLDMTCLNRGFYPSEVVPYKLQSSVAIRRKSRPESLLSEIRAACDNLTAGYWRILKLCNCVSKVIESSSS